MTARFQTVTPILLIVVLAVILTNIFPFRQMIANRDTIALAHDRLAMLRAENDRLEAEVEALTTDAELERLARRDLGYVAPGEIAYVITTPSEPPVTEPAPAPLPEPRTWYEAIWDYLTGRDLVNDSFR